MITQESLLQEIAAFDKEIAMQEDAINKALVRIQGMRQIIERCRGARFQTDKHLKQLLEPAEKAPLTPTGEALEAIKNAVAEQVGDIAGNNVEISQAALLANASGPLSPGDIEKRLKDGAVTIEG